MENKSFGRKSKPAFPKFYDLSEEASRREDEEATTIGRQLENDDSNEETNIGPPGKNTDDWMENKVETSLDE